MDWMAARPELDTQRVAVVGSSFGSFFDTLATAHEPRFRACAVSATCLEPPCHTIFEKASPTSMRRFMYLSGYTEERTFNEFCQSLTWEDHAENIRMPNLCVAGEADELSPLEYAEHLLQALQCPKQVVVYPDSRHSVGNVPSAHLGPHPQTLMADWMAGPPAAHVRALVCRRQRAHRKDRLPGVRPRRAGRLTCRPRFSPSASPPSAGRRVWKPCVPHSRQVPADAPTRTGFRPVAPAPPCWRCRC